MEANRRSAFGISLRQLREAAGLSQEELAERAGLSVRGISDLERGLRTTPRPETVRMLAAGLGLGEGQHAELLAARQSANHPQPNHRERGALNLPVPTSSFIGRAGEIDAIIGIMKNDDARLLTLTGPGGVGKTRIAIEAAHRLAASFPHGAIFVDLSPVRKSDMVIPAIADRFGIPGQGELELKDVLAIALQDRSLLMVLDNLEQVVDAATDIAWLLAACPGLTIIATSRNILRIGAEHVMPIEPMTLPAGNDTRSLEQSEAVALFMTRARAADHRFSLDTENAGAVAALVTHLQGMPLAIELAAARLRMWSVQELLKGLQSHLPLLVGGSRDAPERQRTMRDTIAWSYELLSPTEQAVFRTFAIFPDGCTLETANAVLGVDNRFSEVETLEAVESLVNSSILRPRVGIDGYTRLRMLQTVQDFGQERLAAAGEEHTVRSAAHVTWCEPLARRAEFVRSLPDEVFWLNRIGAEYQNIRSHVAWLISHDKYQDALDISGCLASYRGIIGHFEEGRRELEWLLAHPDNQAPTVTRTRGLIGLGSLCNHQADPDGTWRAMEAGARLANKLGERWYLARAQLAMGLSMLLTDQFDKAEALIRDGLDIGIDLDDKFIISAAMGDLGLVLDQRGDLDRAYELIEESLRVSLSSGNLWLVAFSTINVGYMNLRLGELDRAEELILESERLCTILGNLRDLPIVNIYLADISRRRGELARAESFLEQALALARDIGAIQDIAHSYLGMARLALAKGDFERSQTHTCNAIQWYERCGSLVEAVQCLDGLVEIAIATGFPQRAAWCIGAIDGVLADHKVSRTELVPGEHTARVAILISMLGEDEWHVHYERGRSMSEDEILAEVKSWLSCRISDATIRPTSAQTF